MEAGRELSAGTARKRRADAKGVGTPVRPDDGCAQKRGCMEPVFATLKKHRGYRRFLLRESEKVNAEWQLICAAHNVRQLCAHSSGQPG